MENTKLSPNYCPLSVEELKEPKPLTWFERTKLSLIELKNKIFGESISDETKEELGDLKWKSLPETVKKHLKAKEEILKECISPIGLDEAVVFLEDPKGNKYTAKIDFTTKFPDSGAKQEIHQTQKLVDRTVLSFDSVGGKNGYNTEYRVTTMKNGVTETWTVLAIRFAKMTKEFYAQNHVLKEKERLKIAESTALKQSSNEKDYQIRKIQGDLVILGNLISALDNPKSTKNPKGKGKSKKSAGSEKLSIHERKQEFERRKKRLEVELGEIKKRRDSDRMNLSNMTVEIESISNEIKELAKRPDMKENVSYVPYINLRRTNNSNEILTPEKEKIAKDVERTGFLSLKQSVSKVWDSSDIRNYKTGVKPSAKGMIDTKSKTELTLPEMFPKEIGMVLSIVERMGFVEYLDKYNPETRKGKLKNPEVVKQIMATQIDKALNNLGLNGEGAFDYIRSDAGARGISQMMPVTHKLFVGKYGGEKELLSPTKFDQRYMYASNNQEQSLRFMLVHLYDEGRYFPQEVRDNWKELIADPKTRYGLLGAIAAGYNGDIVRVKSEIGIQSGAKNGSLTDTFDTESIQKRLNGNVETLTYVMKFKYVWEYLKKKFPNEFAVGMKE